MCNFNIGEPLNALLRGVAHDNQHDIRDAWQTLIAHDRASVFAVVEMLNGGSFSRNINETQGRYLAVLLSLLLAVDPEAFRSAIARLRTGALHIVHKQTIDLVENRSRDEPVQREVAGIQVAVSSFIDDCDVVLRYVEKWLQTPKRSDLEGILRIDVVPNDATLDYLGYFNYAFSGIVLIWPQRENLWLLRALKRNRVEATLYHEIGHHVNRHSEGGQVPDQEKEANLYQKRHMQKAHPIWRVIALTVYHWPCRLIKRWIEKPEEPAKRVSK